MRNHAAARLYTLSASSPAAEATLDISVSVGPVSIPAAVDRPQIVVATAANQLRLDDFNRWASPLQENLSSVIATTSPLCWAARA